MGTRPAPTARPSGAWAVLLALVGLLLLAAPAQAQEATPSPSTGSTLTEPDAPEGGGTDEEEASEFVIGTLNNAGEPVEGATVTVEQDGDEVASADTDERGRFRVPLPGPGEYTVVLDTDTLPDGVELRREGGDEVQVDVRAGRSAPALFLLGENTRGSGSRLDRAPQLIVGQNGVSGPTFVDNAQYREFVATTLIKAL